MQVFRIALLVCAVGAVSPWAAAQTPRFRHLQGGQYEGALFVNATDGFVAGDSRIHFTENGGGAWEEAEIENAETNEAIRVPLRGMFAVTGDQIFCVGDGGVVMRSVSEEDGRVWEDWNGQSGGNRVLDANDVPAVLYDIFMISETVGWSVGEDGAIAKTVNGGLAWTNVADNVSAQFDPGEDPWDAYVIHFFEDSGTGFDPYDKGILASEYGRIFLTDDAGATWTEVDVRSDAPTYCPAGGQNLEFWAFAFDDPTDASSPIWVAGGAGENTGYIFRSTGGGGENTWSQSSCYQFETDELEKAAVICGIPTLYVLEMLDAASTPQRKIASGYAGYLMEYEDGTVNFDPCTCSTTIENCTSSEVPKWVQKDTAYDPLDPLSNRTPFFAGARISNTKVCLAGSFGRIGIYDSEGNLGTGSYTDVGSTAPMRINDGAFLDGTTGCIIGQGWLPRYTEDGGATWSAAETSWEPIEGTWGNGIAFASDGLHGVVVGSAGFRARTDNASSPSDPWTNWIQASATNTPDLNAVIFVGESTGACTEPETAYAVGNTGRILKSEDYGVSWVTLSSPTENDLHGVSFATPCVGYVVGVNLTIYKTTDGGVNWREVGTTGGSGETLYDVQTWGDGSEAIAVGQNGAVFVRSTGNFVKVPEEATSGEEFGFEVTEHLYDVEVLNSGTNVRVGGDKGAVLFRDSGTWTRKRSDTTHPLSKLAFQSASEGFAIGQMFVVLKYDD
ncbi:MAG: WD40/YVTN/BNR-like repeat-containing protein [Planctomycetota bacterium]